eukprot:tig00020563_g11377.t1
MSESQRSFSQRGPRTDGQSPREGGRSSGGGYNSPRSHGGEGGGGGRYNSPRGGYDRRPGGDSRGASPRPPLDPSRAPGGSRHGPEGGAEGPTSADDGEGGGAPVRKDLRRVMGGDPSSMRRVSSTAQLEKAGSMHRVGSWDMMADASRGDSMRRVSSMEGNMDKHGGGGGTGGGGMSRSSSRNRIAPPATVWAKWAPAESVIKLTPQEVEEIRKSRNISVSGEEPVPNPVQYFDELNVDDRILADIASHKYIKPTPIQCQALPAALSGRDILGFAETGSGKTAAFCIPMIAHILHQSPIQRGDGPIALVLAPTRELAQQIDKEAKMFSISSRIKGTIVVGGAENMGSRRGGPAPGGWGADGGAAGGPAGGVDFVVATPGRFIQHLQQGNTALSRCSFLVLDEADRMLDMGFEDQIHDIVARIAKERQTLLFSATMPEEIEALAEAFLKNPIRISIGTVNKPTKNVTQFLEYTPEERKKQRLIEIIRVDEEEAMERGKDQPQILVFVETKIKCEELCVALLQEGHHADRLHADRTQPQREAALQSYRDGMINVLIATDLASRGLDVTGITHVINYDLPKKMEDYVHRIGRTGRAGTWGKATSFYDDRDADIVLSIRRAIADAHRPESGGGEAVFAAGKAARRREKAEKEEQRLRRKELEEQVAAMNVDDKYKHMLLQPLSDRTESPTPPSGAAPSAGPAGNVLPPRESIPDAWDD